MTITITPTAEELAAPIVAGIFALNAAFEHNVPSTSDIEYDRGDARRIARDLIDLSDRVAALVANAAASCTLGDRSFVVAGQARAVVRACCTNVDEAEHELLKDAVRRVGTEALADY
jgi:hypothetical protein